MSEESTRIIRVNDRLDQPELADRQDTCSPGRTKDKATQNHEDVRQIG